MVFSEKEAKEVWLPKHKSIEQVETFHHRRSTRRELGRNPPTSGTRGSFGFLHARCRVESLAAPRLVMATPTLTKKRHQHIAATLRQLDSWYITQGPPIEVPSGRVRRPTRATTTPCGMRRRRVFRTV